MRIDNPTVGEGELTLLRELARDHRVLELGSGRGFATVELCKVARAVVSVDWHKGDDQAGRGDTLASFMERVRPWIESGKLSAVVARFEDYLPLTHNAGFELIFHDGHHGRESVFNNLRLALPALSWGGWIAVHDWGLYGVKEATDVIFGAPDLRVRTLAAWGPNLGRWYI